MNKQRGFSVVEVLLVAVVVAVLAFVGYRIYQNRQVKTDVPAPQSSVPEVKTTADLDKASKTLDDTNVDALDSYDQQLGTAEASF